MNLVKLSSSLFRCASQVSALTPVASRPAAHNMVRSARQFCAATEAIFDIESVEEFNEKVIQSAVPVLVDFYADWCGPCQVLGPRLEEKILGRHGTVTMARVNVDYAGELAADYNISAVPTVMSFKNGENINSFQGAIEDDQIDAFIDQAINS